jgi:hypothetical protein
VRTRVLETIAAAVLAVTGFGGVPAARAGGGPETTVVVENADSPLSRHLANEYVRLRGIPPGRTLSLPGLPTQQRTDVGTFRTKVLAPVRAFLADRGLADRVDLVVYSVDFPVAVDFSADGKSVHPSTPPVGSFTGMAYLERLVERKEASVYGDFHRVVNGYFRRSPATANVPAAWATRAFSPRVAWGETEEPDATPSADADGVFRLAAMLGWAGPWGNTTDEILRSLAASAGADGTNPKGTVYLCRSTDAARTGPRAPFFDETVSDLAALGRRAVILSKDDAGQTGVLPVGKDDVLGAVVGIADFAWASCNSRMLPGAFADHLTSHAASFEHGGQTKCSEWIRHGAAGSCGTVVEPLNAWIKFPVPRFHVHYASGASLAEAYYQSVANPYQLLLLGDPLARPFARFAKVEPAARKEKVSGTVAVEARATPAPDRPLARVELWVDGAFVAEGAPGTDLAWDTTRFDDGPLEVRLVAVDATPVATRTSAVATAVVANGTLAPPTLVWPKTPVAFGTTVDLSGQAPGARTVEVLANGRRVAEAPVRGDAWSAKDVPAAAFGMGPVAVRVRAVPEKGPAVRGVERDVRILPPAAAKRPRSRVRGAGTPGLRATLTDAAGKAHEVVLSSLGGPGLDPVARTAEAKRKGPWKKVVVEGEFEAKAGGVHQLDVLATGLVRLEVDGVAILEGDRGAARAALYGLASLDPGWHALRIELAPDGPADLTVLLAGAQVAAPLSGPALRH